MDYLTGEYKKSTNYPFQNKYRLHRPAIIFVAVSEEVVCLAEAASYHSVQPALPVFVNQVNPFFRFFLLSSSCIWTLKAFLLHPLPAVLFVSFQPLPAVPFSSFCILSGCSFYSFCIPFCCSFLLLCILWLFFLGAFISFFLLFLIFSFVFLFFFPSYILITLLFDFDFEPVYVLILSNLHLKHFPIHQVLSISSGLSNSFCNS